MLYGQKCLYLTKWFIRLVLFMTFLILKLLNGSKFTLLGVRYEKNDKHGLVQRWEE